MNEINFLPTSFVRQRAKRRRAVLHVVTIALSLVVGVGFWTVERGRTVSLRHSVEALESQADAVKQQQTAAAKLMSEYKALLHQTQVQRELAQPVTQTQVLAVLGKVLPVGVSLVHVDLQATRPTPAAVAPSNTPGKKADKSKPAARPMGPQYLSVTIQAIAPDDMTVANVVGLLSDHPLFSNVRLKHSRAVELNKLTWRQFELTVRVDLDRDIQPTRNEVAYAY